MDAKNTPQGVIIASEFTVIWFRERVGGTGKRMRKVMVVAMARRLLIALRRFVTQGVVPEGAAMKPAS